MGGFVRPTGPSTAWNGEDYFDWLPQFDPVYFSSLFPPQTLLHSFFPPSLCPNFFLGQVRTSLLARCLVLIKMMTKPDLAYLNRVFRRQSQRASFFCFFNVLHSLFGNQHDIFKRKILHANLRIHPTIAPRDATWYHSFVPGFASAPSSYCSVAFVCSRNCRLFNVGPFHSIVWFLLW